MQVTDMHPRTRTPTHTCLQSLSVHAGAVIVWPTSSSLPPYRRFLPFRFSIVGYARSELTNEQLRDRIKPYLKGEEESVSQFLNACSYIQGEVGGRVPPAGA